MTTIQKALIAQYFPAIDITLIAEIIDATPNAEIATEILCGLYESPTIPEKVFNDDKSILYTMDHFDKWKGYVNYHYYSPKRVSAYFPNSVKSEIITEENYESLKCPNSDDGVYHYWVSCPSMMEKSTSGMELSTWMKRHSKFPYAEEVVEIKMATGHLKSGPPRREFDMSGDEGFAERQNLLQK